jgi:putative ATPase
MVRSVPDPLVAPDAYPRPVGETLFEAVTPAMPEHAVAGPLAARLRPRSVDEVVGQDHLLGAGGPLSRLLAAGAGSSVVLYGPPGTGKTTLALLLSRSTSAHFVELSAVNAGVSQVRAAIAEARERLRRHGEPTVLFIDEVHRFSRTQQDALLPAVENGWVTLVAATTENPSYSMVSPLLSRSLVLELEPLTEQDLRALLSRALDHPEGLAERVAVSERAAEHLCRLAAGDGRRLLTLLEAAAAGLPPGGGSVEVGDVEQVAQRVALRYDRAGDQHYDIASALIKSIRGSDVDAALHYLARMAEAGEDPRFLARRLVVLASEDVGLADSSALPLAVAAAQAVALVGWPEARITLAHAVIALALAPKSNAVVLAIDEALHDVRARGGGRVPPHLRGTHPPAYRYPHDDPRGVLAQQYPPDDLVDRRYYRPSGRGGEAALRDRWENLRDIVRGSDPKGRP